MIRNISLLSLFLIILLGCSDENKCQGVCTAQFVTIAVNIEDENGNPVVLDSFTVTLTDTNRDITEDLYYNPSHMDSYPIINDNFTTEAKSNDLKVQFIGKINSQVVVEENYVIGADCCHIHLISGEIEIII